MAYGARHALRGLAAEGRERVEEWESTQWETIASTRRMISHSAGGHPAGPGHASRYNGGEEQAPMWVLL